MTSKKRYEAPGVRHVTSTPSGVSAIASAPLHVLRCRSARASAIRRALSAACPDLDFGIIAGLASAALELEASTAKEKL